jgi:hypothetical protein
MDKRETLKIALANMTRYGLALERISRHPTADTWECKPLADIAREALGLTPYDVNEQSWQKTPELRMDDRQITVALLESDGSQWRITHKHTGKVETGLYAMIPVDDHYMAIQVICDLTAGMEDRRKLEDFK